MARLARRRTRSPESDDENDASSRAQTPLSTAPSDRKRARRSTRNEEDSDDPDDEPAPPLARRPPVSSMPSTSSQPVNARDADHQPGAIVRVKLTNFVTYSKAEFFPGPSLNMVIGPNGTGKSTLVCAICLGLGWGTQVLGRGKDVGEFVKHGAAEATIEIELKRAKGRRNPVITRRIKKDGNKSEWLLNNEASGQNAIKAMAKQFNIHLDNLCQFLPQDKVVEFAQMDPKEVLRSTQEAAGTARMIDCHDALIKMRAQQKHLLTGQRTDKEELENLNKRQDAQRSEVERLRDREKFQEKMGWLEKTKLIPDFFTARRTAEEAKKSQQTLARDLDELKKESDPIMRQLDAKKIYQRDVSNIKARRENELKEAESKAGDAAESINSIQQTIEGLEKSITADKTLAGKKKTDLIPMKQNLAIMKNRSQQPRPEIDAPAMNAMIADLKHECEDLEERKRVVKQEAADFESQYRTRQKDVTTLEKAIANFDTQTGKLERRLETLSADTLKAWHWIKENQQIFEKPILGPPALVCDLPDRRMAPAIETILNKTDMCFITAQTHGDFSLLQGKLAKDLKVHDVSLRVQLDDNLDAYKVPYSPEELQRLGLSGYAIDLIEGPSVVLAVLCGEKMLHRVGIANERVSTEQHRRLLDTQLSGYFSDNTSYQFVRRNDLGQGAAISRSSGVKKPTIWTDQPVNLGRKAAMQREMNEKKSEMEELRTNLNALKQESEDANEKIRSLQKEMEDIKSEKAKKQAALAEWSGLPSKIRDLEKKVADIHEFLSSVRARREDWQSEIANAQVDRAEAAVQYADTVRVIKDCMTRLIEVEVQLIEAESDHEVLGEKNRAIKELLETKTEEEKQAREESKAATLKVRQLAKAATKVREEADVLKAEGKPGLLDLMLKMRDDQWTPADYEAEVEATNAQLALTEGGNADAIKQWEDRQKKIETLTARIGNSGQQLEEALAAIREVREEWEPELQKLVAKISDAFGESFARIGCAGQVEVGKKNSEATEDCTEQAGGEENGLDFANWTIRISVKFRENEPLSLLDSRRQSGGERAVSTIFYLMALQSLSRAPFRVVDEINQGMDGRNERMVHGRMVDVATAKRDASGQGGSQYFLITPKLLSGLKYKRGMTVLCIVSGEHVMAEGERVTDSDAAVPFKTYPRLDFRQFAMKARELGLGATRNGGVAAVGRRIDSGVAMVGA